MNWKTLNATEQIRTIETESMTQPVLLFKHSTRCSISQMVKNRLERSWSSEETPDVACYYLDLLQYRAVSGLISETFGIAHESPQALIISKGKCVYSSTHTAVNYPDIKDALESLQSPSSS